MKRLLLSLALLLGLVGIVLAAAPVTWNPADISSGMSLSNGNLTASSVGFVATSVRSTTSYSAGKICFEVAAPTITTGWTVGVANSTFALNNPAGVGVDTNAIGIDPNSPGASQGIFFNNSAASSGATQSVNGEIVTVCVDFTNKLFWATDKVMRAASQPWNNSASASPATGTGGVPFTASTGPWFMIFNEYEAGVGVLNATGPFAVTTPSGFSPWQAASTGSHPTMVIMGE
jgi:hypothetical protein